MGGNRIDELGAAAKGVVAAFNALVEHLPRLRELPQFKTMEIPPVGELDVLIQGFGAVGANTARLFHENTRNYRPRIKGISDATGYLLNPDGLPWSQLFSMWKTLGNVAGAYYHERIMHGSHPVGSKTVFSNNPDNLLTESAFCLIPASPVFNYLDVSPITSPSMTCDRMGKWQMIVEGANTYSPDPARKAQRRRMERHVFRDRGILIATDYLVNAGGVIYAAHERIIPTPRHLYIPKDLLGDPGGIQGWLDKHRTEFQRLAEQRQKAALEKLETVIPANMKELIQGLCRDGDSLPCEVAEKISVRRIASKEKSKTARDVMAPAPVIGLDKQITDAAELLVESHVSIVTVVSEKGRPIGIVTNWDITRATALKLPMDAPLTKIMTTDLVSTGPDTSILNCIRILENHEISAMPVVDENRVLGIISGDILARKTLFRLLQTEG
jgi:glutamate dehydrogenase (NAD(P)+)